MILLCVLAAFLWLPVAAAPSASCNATLAISPHSGPIGTLVTITGRGFTAACDLTAGTNGDGLILQSGGRTSTFGYAPVADPGRDPPVGADGAFALTYAIPATLYEYHSAGGGPVVPGPYYFHTVPPAGKVPNSAAEADAALAPVTFVVTGPVAFPTAGAGGLVLGGKGALPLLVALAAGFVLAGRTGKRRGASHGR